MSKKYYLYSGIGVTPLVTPLVTSERQIEQKLVRAARAKKALALKWVSPSFAGVPDRIVFLPGGRIVFVELKRPGGKLQAIQQRVHALLGSLGADVRVIDSMEGVDALFT